MKEINPNAYKNNMLLTKCCLSSAERERYSSIPAILFIAAGLWMLCSLFSFGMLLYSLTVADTCVQDITPYMQGSQFCFIF